MNWLQDCNILASAQLKAQHACSSYYSNKVSLICGSARAGAPIDLAGDSTISALGKYVLAG